MMENSQVLIGQTYDNGAKITGRASINEKGKVNGSSVNLKIPF
jgi:hypothetical protein